MTGTSDGDESTLRTGFQDPRPDDDAESDEDGPFIFSDWSKVSPSKWVAEWRARTAWGRLMLGVKAVVLTPMWLLVLFFEAYAQLLMWAILLMFAVAYGFAIGIVKLGSWIHTAYRTVREFLPPVYRNSA